jgi:dihydroxyacid dehydratase/phosphogluconate dehydratase
MKELRILAGVNNYAVNVQGKANEPVCVAGLLDRARMALGFRDIEYPLDAIYDRLEANAPRIAVIGGSLDHPAHIVDWDTTLRAAYRIWQCGGVPFYFAVPVVCDGAAQSNIGMSYSLQSRNAVAAMVVNQMEAHSYHGAFVIQGCDKTPMGIVSALACLDQTRKARGDAPVFATFAPAHVLRGGTIPDDLREELGAVAARAETAGKAHLAEEVRDTMRYILQCSSNQAFQGILGRLVQEAVISEVYHKHLEKQLAVNTCDAKGGICAFNGTGNSSRHVVSAFGLVHPAVELLTGPPTQEQVNQAADPLFSFCNDPAFSVSSIVRQNIENAVRIHSATGGSTNLMMHIVGAMLYAGVSFSLWDYDRIRRAVPVPDIFDYSLTQGRDIFALAQQCCDGAIRGMETAFYELLEQGVPMNLDALTVTGTTWRERLADKTGLSALGVAENPVILASPRRPFSGVDVLTGNFFDTAVVKMSGMSTQQIDEFDDKVFLSLYYENEEEATDALLNVHLLEELRDARAFPIEDLVAIARHHGGHELASAAASALSYGEVFDTLARERALKLLVFISGQGPAAFGMPEMFTPMQHINSNRSLSPLVVLISDGRYSGVTYGAAIGHVTPEAAMGGGVLYVLTGDLFVVRLRQRRVDLIDREAFRGGRVQPATFDLDRVRETLGKERLARIRARRERCISPTNTMLDVTDAAHGVVPRAVAEAARTPYTHGAGTS